MVNYGDSDATPLTGADDIESRIRACLRPLLEKAGK
jgi:hypothetical protein